MLNSVLVVLLTAAITVVENPADLSARVDLVLSLDSVELIAGEPLSGETVLSNTSGGPICISHFGDRLTEFLSFHMVGPSGEFDVPAYPYESMRSPHVYWPHDPRRTQIEYEAVVREPVFLLARSISRGFNFEGDDLGLITGEPGEYEVSARLSVRMPDERFHLVAESDPVSFVVAAPGRGYWAYDSLVRAQSRPITGPFNSSYWRFLTALFGPVDYKDYWPAIDAAVAYLYGYRLIYPMLYGYPDPDRPHDFIVEQLRGGIVGAGSLKIRKWRVAHLLAMGELVDAREWSYGAFDYEAFIGTMPNRSGACE